VTPARAALYYERYPCVLSATEAERLPVLVALAGRDVHRVARVAVDAWGSAYDWARQGAR